MVLSQAPLPAIGHHQMLVFLLQVGLLLVVAVLLGRLATWFRLPRVVGELSAGVLLGPSVFGNLLPDLRDWLLPHDTAQMHLLAAVAQLGVLLLVGITGAHIDFGLIRSKRKVIGYVSAASVLLPLALGVGLGFLMPQSLMAPGAERGTFALFVGVAIAVSALPVIAKTLLDMNLLHRNVGQLIIGAAAISDIVGWMLLSVVAAMATRGLTTGLVLESVGYLIAVLVATVLVARPVARKVLEFTDRSPQKDVSAATIAAMILLFSAGTLALDMEPILGAFLCGMVICSLGTSARRSLDSMRTFVMSTLAPLYFATAGLQVDLSALTRPTVLLAAVVTLLIATLAKFAGGYLGARMGGLQHGEGLAIGAGLNARGVVEIVIATVGLNLGVLTTATYTIVVLIAVITSMMAPPFLRHATRSMPTTTAEHERQRELAGQAS